MKKILFAVMLAASAIVFNSCGPSRYTVVDQPAVPVYARPVAPGPEYVWVDGDWRWQGGRYVYTNGYWVKPRPNHVWVSGNWQRTNKGYYWRRGHWR